MSGRGGGEKRVLATRAPRLAKVALASLEFVAQFLLPVIKKVDEIIMMSISQSSHHNIYTILPNVSVYS